MEFCPQTFSIICYVHTLYIYVQLPTIVCIQILKMHMEIYCWDTLVKLSK